MAYTAIDDPEAYFQTQLYTGNGSADHAITFGGDTDMQPDFVWIKNRDAADSHCLFDSVRGATKLISSDATNAESTDTDTLDSFATDGFQVDADVKVNTNAEKYVAWCWKAGTSFTNDQSATGVGSIDSDGSINTTSGFAIIRWSGTASNATIAHGIAAPKMMIIKRISGGTEQWVVYHQAISPAKHLFLNLTDAETADTNNFQNTATTSSVFSVGTYNQMNASGTDNMIAYCFAPKQGFSKFGSYISNNSSDGVFVYLGFKPSFVMVKGSSAAGLNWVIHDNKRHSVTPASGGTNFNVINRQLMPNLTNADDTNDGIDFLSNGFKWRWNGGDVNGTAGRTYVYMAFAEAPFVNSNGVPCNAR